MCTGYHCNVQGVMLCYRSLKQTAAITLSSCESASTSAGSFGICSILRRTSLQSSSSCRNGLRSCTSGTPQAHRKSLLGHTKLDQRRASVGWIVDAKRNTEHLFTIFKRNHERSRYPKNMSYISMKTWTAESLTNALPVEQGCKYLQLQQLTDCTLRRH